MTESDQSGARWLDCCQLLQELASEVKDGLAALSANDLESFESSVAAQERLCESARPLRTLLSQQTTPAPHQQLGSATLQLSQHNRIYLAAIRRASQTCAALLSLYQDSPRGYSPDGRVPPTTKTWSCEV